MPIKFGTNDIGDIYYGSNKIAKVYYGNTLVYENFKPDYYNFNYTGSVQSLVIPKGCTRFLVTCRGASSGRCLQKDNSYTSRVGSGLVLCSLAVTPNQTARFYVGGCGADAPRSESVTPVTVSGGYNGGGDGAAQVYMLTTLTAGGGGASDIRLGGTSLNNRVVVAGGGGSNTIFGGDTETTYTGGVGGGLSGGNAQSASSVIGAKGGSQSSGGAKEYWESGSQPVNSTDGSLGSGGIYGGGGGYYGGGGGAFSGGGGGSSYTSSTLCTDVKHYSGDTSETNGFISIITASSSPVPFYYYEYGNAMIGIYSPKKIKETGTYNFYKNVSLDSKIIYSYSFTTNVTGIVKSGGEIVGLNTDDYGQINARMATTPAGYW